MVQYAATVFVNILDIVFLCISFALSFAHCTHTVTSCTQDTLYYFNQGFILINCVCVVDHWLN